MSPLKWPRKPRKPRKTMLKILYAGSPAPAAKTLKLLLEKSSAAMNGLQEKKCGGENLSQAQNRGWKIAGVLTNPPSAKGRHKELLPTNVAALAQENGIQVFCPQKLDAAAREQIADAGFDALVCFAYGKIFGPKFLSLFKAGRWKRSSTSSLRWVCPSRVTTANSNCQQLLLCKTPTANKEE